MPNGKKDTRRMVLISDDIGIAPFISYSLHLKSIGTARELVLLHGSDYVDALPYSNLLFALEEESNNKGKEAWNFQYKASISRPSEWFNKSWGDQVGGVESFLKPRHNGNVFVLGRDCRRGN